ncbi:hypothetical protein ACFVYA_26695 [Amycolatopsis sp. NPDC058278]|uniref:hypothetical protein n=1 Tax=Amycolatopsis sp. NPDC058278 TaxID=3346417 RepID=UPI0036D7F77D
MLAEPTPEERSRAVRVVQRYANDSHDEAERKAMLGLDQAEPAPPRRRPHGALTTAELHDMLAPFAAECGRRPDDAR